MTHPDVLLLARLMVLSLTGVGVFASWVNYQMMRYSDGAWGDVAAFQGAACIALPGSLVTLLLVLRLNRLGVPRRDYLAGLTCWVLMVGGFLAGGLAGRWQRGREFDANREEAEAVVGRLEAYRAERGEYPADLGAVGGGTVFRGGRQDDMRYWRASPTRFVLSYGYGWYEYRYDSDSREWEERD
jgi:hypothetical protein